MNNFEEQLAEILEVESVKETDELASFDSWDSLTILSIIALIDENYGVPMTSDQIEDTISIGGLTTYVQERSNAEVF